MKKNGVKSLQPGVAEISLNQNVVDGAMFDSTPGNNGIWPVMNGPDKYRRHPCVSDRHRRAIIAKSFCLSSTSGETAVSSSSLFHCLRRGSIRIHTNL